MDTEYFFDFLQKIFMKGVDRAMFSILNIAFWIGIFMIILVTGTTIFSLSIDAKVISGLAKIGLGLVALVFIIKVFEFII